MSKNYPEELKQSMVKRMLPPESISASALARETGISKSALRSWINDKKELSPIKSKFHIVVETYSMNEYELSTYCRKNGLFTEDIKQWKIMFEQAELPPILPESTSKKSEIISRDLKMRYVEKIRH